MNRPYYRPRRIQEPPIAVPDQPQRRKHARQAFRREYFLVLLVLLGLIWILAGVEGAAFSFDDVMDFMNVRYNREEFRQLATIGLIAVGVVWVVRILKSEDSSD